jgi:hypothetical protein
VSLETESEDRTILEALDALASGRSDGELEGVGADEASQTLARLYTEVLGLLPYELDPVAPSPAVQERLMAIVAGDETQAIDGDAAHAANAAHVANTTGTAAAPAAIAAPIAPIASASTPAAAQAAPPRRLALPRAAEMPPRRRSRWPLALAAALILALLGVSGWLYQGLREQGQTIASLSRELAEARRESGELARVRTEMADLQGKLSLVTSPAVEIHPLRPSGLEPVQPRARGLFFVAEDHQHWYLSVDNLEPARPGQEYQLWFIADTGPVSAGTFTAAPGAPIALSSEHMPEGTRAVIITLERERGAAAPTGPEILRM